MRLFCICEKRRTTVAETTQHFPLAPSPVAGQGLHSGASRRRQPSVRRLRDLTTFHDDSPLSIRGEKEGRGLSPIQRPKDTCDQNADCRQNNVHPPMEDEPTRYVSHEPTLGLHTVSIPARGRIMNMILTR